MACQVRGARLCPQPIREGWIAVRQAPYGRLPLEVPPRECGETHLYTSSPQRTLQNCLYRTQETLLIAPIRLMQDEGGSDPSWILNAISVAQVPEPSTALLLLSGLLITPLLGPKKKGP